MKNNHELDFELQSSCHYRGWLRIPGQNIHWSSACLWSA